MSPAMMLRGAALSVVQTAAQQSCPIPSSSNLCFSEQKKNMLEHTSCMAEHLKKDLQRLTAQAKEGKWKNVDAAFHRWANDACEIYADEQFVDADRQLWSFGTAWSWVSEICLASVIDGEAYLFQAAAKHDAARIEALLAASEPSGLRERWMDLKARARDSHPHPAADGGEPNPEIWRHFARALKRNEGNTRELAGTLCARLPAVKHCHQRVEAWVYSLVDSAKNLNEEQ